MEKRVAQGKGFAFSRPFRPASSSKIYPDNDENDSVSLHSIEQYTPPHSVSSNKHIDYKREPVVFFSSSHNCFFIYIIRGVTIKRSIPPSK